MRKINVFGKGAAVFVAAVLTATAVMAMLLLADNRGPNRVAAVDGQAVTEEELLFHMKRLRPYVHDEFKNKYGITLSAEDWLEETGGQQPMGVLRERALDEIAKDKALFMAEHREGLISYIDFEQMLASMTEENKHRQAAVKRGEIVYGLVSFTPDIYYSHVVSSLKTELKKKLSRGEKGPLYTEESELEKAFREDKSAWAANATSYAVTSLNFPFNSDEEKEVMRKKLIGLVS